MIPINDQSKDIDLSNHLDVCLDGKVLGFVHPDNLRYVDKIVEEGESVNFQP